MPTLVLTTGHHPYKLSCAPNRVDHHASSVTVTIPIVLFDAVSAYGPAYVLGRKTDVLDPKITASLGAAAALAGLIFHALLFIAHIYKALAVHITLRRLQCYTLLHRKL